MIGHFESHAMGYSGTTRFPDNRSSKYGLTREPTLEYMLVLYVYTFIPNVWGGMDVVDRVQ